MPIQTIRSIFFGTQAVPEPIIVQQGDYQSRCVQLALYEAPGVPCDLEGAVFSVVCRKDGTNSKPFEAQAVQDNLVAFLLPSFAAETPGNGVLQLRMYQAGGLLHSGLIPFSVKHSLEEGEGGEEPVEAFAALLEEAAHAIEAAQAAASHPPIIGEEGTWLVWDAEHAAYQDSGKTAIGTSLRVLGSLTDAALLPETAQPGDTYLIDGELHVYAGIGWENIGSAGGSDGKAASIRIGSVSTLAPGSSATVTNTGTETDAVLHFGIPRGYDGTGPGTGSTDGGYYVPSVNAAGELCWTASQSHMPAVEPVMIKGADGANGIDGADGYSPVRGTDYWTESDIAAIQGYVNDAILNGRW